MSDKCPFCGNKENPSSSNSEDSCHWVGEYGEKFKGLRSLPCYERQITQCQERLAVAEGIIAIISDCISGNPEWLCKKCRNNIEAFLTHAPGEYVAVRREDLDYALSIIHVNIWGIKGDGGDAIDRLKAALEGK